MKLTDEHAQGLATTLSLTRETELNCSECLDHVAEFAESELAGKAISGALEAVEHHLALCGECREEFESLLAVLKVLSEDQD